MKKFIIVAILFILTAGNLNAQNNRTTAVKAKFSIPKEYVGHWQKGAFSLTNFEEYDGKYVGPANETSVSYIIDENGIAKEYFIANTNSYNCRMQVLGYREGSIVFNTFDNSFEFEPTSGYYSTLSCMSKTQTKKQYAAKDLYPNYVVRGIFKKDESGNVALVTLNSSAKEGLVFKKLR